jgi:hypothetical protein
MHSGVKQLEAIEKLATEDEEKCWAPKHWIFDFGAWEFAGGLTPPAAVSPMPDNITVADAVKKCAGVTGCKGFTFEGNNSKPKGPVPVSFKGGWSKAAKPTRCDTQCRLPPNEYRKSEMCKPESIAVWKMHARMDRRGDCTVDEDSGMIHCVDKGTCASEHTMTLHKVDVERSATYDCTVCNREETELRIECCRLCKEVTCKEAKAGKFNIKGHQIDEVICKGCSKKDMEAIAKMDSNFCTLFPGHFSCKYNVSCRTLEPNVEVHDTTYSCGCNDCGSCGDEDLRAQCCVDCLSRTCAEGSGEDAARQVCAGCWPLPLTSTTSFVPHPSLRPPQWKK